MTSQLNLPGMQDLTDGTANWVGSTYTCRLLMTNTTAGTQNNVADLTGYSTIDSFDGIGASNVALASKASNVDSTNNRVELDANDVAFGALGTGTRAIKGVVIYGPGNVPLVYVEFSASFNPGGASVTIIWDAEGILQFGM